jgi:hypothetical protein
VRLQIFSIKSRVMNIDISDYTEHVFFFLLAVGRNEAKVFDLQQIY